MTPDGHCLGMVEDEERRAAVPAPATMTTHSHCLGKVEVEHPFGTIKAWMGATHFRLKTLEKVKTEMSLHVLAYNIKRTIQILGTGPLMHAMRA